MDGDPIPDENHVARHVKYTALDEAGNVTSAAFILRPNEDYLSVQWVEYLGPYGQIGTADRIREALALSRALKPTQKIAMLNVGKTTNLVRDSTGIKLKILHKPINPNDLAHSGIYGVPQDDLLVGALIAHTIVDSIPAVDGVRQGS